MSRLVVAAVTTLVTAACGGDVPTEPTWFGDVQPIIAANCGRCHGAQPYQPSLAGFRLDRYVAGDDQTVDAFDYRDRIIAKAVRLEAPAMPLDYELTERQRLILQRWLDAGAPKGERPNTAPGATAVAPTGRVEADQSFDLTFRAFDADGDGLVVSLLARETGDSGGDLVATGLAQGMHTVAIDTGVLASKQTFEIIAVLDDGYFDDPSQNHTEVAVLSEVFVDHGDRGTAPRVTLLAPNDGSSIAGSTEIRWSATDPDPGDEILTIDLDLLRVEADGSETVVGPIASGLTSDQQSFSWDVSDVPNMDASGASLRYKVRVTATDTGAKNTRSDSSDKPFTIAPETPYTWDDQQPVRPFFLTYCVGCHGEPAFQPSLDGFRFDKYDIDDPVDPINTDLGVYEKRTEIRARLNAGTMPPPASRQPTDSEIAMIDSWIAGGAPRGNASASASFVWNTPNNMTIISTTTGMVTLQWTATDPAGGLFTGTISQTTISPPSDALAECTADLPGYTEVPGVDINAGSHALTLPTGGYYCFRADVTTEGGAALPPQVAAEPIKYDRPGPGL